jgi:hypothetical protein
MTAARMMCCLFIVCLF